MTLKDALIFANEAFYQTFSDRDADALAAVWASGDDCICVHPGWNPIFGTEAILQSFADILAGPHPPHIECQIANAYVLDDVGVVICFEQIGDQTLVATNLFRRNGSRWQIFHHHAGPAQFLPDDESASEPSFKAN